MVGGLTTVQDRGFVLVIQFVLEVSDWCKSLAGIRQAAKLKWIVVEPAVVGNMHSEGGFCC